MRDADPFLEFLKTITPDDSLRATVYAMNTLLIFHGVYRRHDFERVFREYIAKKKAKEGAVK